MINEPGDGQLRWYAFSARIDLILRIQAKEVALGRGTRLLCAQHEHAVVIADERAAGNAASSKKPRPLDF